MDLLPKKTNLTSSVPAAEKHPRNVRYYDAAPPCFTFRIVLSGFLVLYIYKM